MKKSNLFTINTKMALHLSFLAAVFLIGNLSAQEATSQKIGANGEGWEIKSAKPASGLSARMAVTGSGNLSFSSGEDYNRNTFGNINFETYGNYQVELSGASANPVVYFTTATGIPLKFGIGTTTPDEKLTVNGKIHAKGVRVDLLHWPDYVFRENYTLPTLLEVEQHIKEKGHLQNIPSATEVEENGIELGEMDKKLLQKIEELTLYTIAQEKKIKNQEVTNQKLKISQDKLETKNQALEARLAKLETLLMKK